MCYAMLLIEIVKSLFTCLLFGLVWFYFRINQHLKEHSKIYVKEIRLVAHFSCNYNCYCCSSMGPVTIT